MDKLTPEEINDMINAFNSNGKENNNIQAVPPANVIPKKPPINQRTQKTLE